MSTSFGFRYAHEDPFSMEYSCGVCSRAWSDEDLSNMILCEGGCKRIFHIECVGLSAMPDTSASSKWACSRCVQRVRGCYVCDGVDGTSALIKCSIAHCGKQFHRACLASRYPKCEGDICPLHACAAEGCTAPITDESYFCILCLRAYHLRCSPEEVPVVCENVCVCVDHQWTRGTAESTSVKDRLLGAVLGRKLIAKRAGGETVAVVTPDNSVPSSPNNLTSLEANSVHGWLGRNFREPFSLEAMRPFSQAKIEPTAQDTSGLDFVRLRTNEWLCERKKIERDSCCGSCGCANVCDENCANVVCMTQCDWTNCGISNELRKKGDKGADCGNKPFGTGKNSGLYKVTGAGSKGVGLVAKRAIAKDAFLVEYIGEVLSTDLWLERQKLEPPNSHKHFYVMELGPELLIDASRKGNDSRLMNHSCDPNCETQKWTVNGESRVGLFAIKSIAKDEELTFNYQFETFAAKPFKCLCNTELCTGWIGGKRKEKQVKKSASSSLLLPYTQLEERSCVDIRLSSTRTDGTRKLDEELEQEELAVFNSKVDWALQYVWAGSQSAEEWVKNGRICVSNDRNLFNPAAILGLSVSKVEEHFIAERNLFVLRNLRKCRRDFARKFYHWSETIPAIEAVLETNLISDDVCVRCRRPGQLLWCKTCVRSFHQCCIASGDKFLRDPNAGGQAHQFTCRRCMRPDAKDLSEKTKVEIWAQRRQAVWRGVILPTLLAGNGHVFTRKRTSRKRPNDAM